MSNVVTRDANMKMKMKSTYQDPCLSDRENYKEGIEAQCCVKRECMKKNKCEKNISLMAGFIGSIRA